MVRATEDFSAEDERLTPERYQDGFGPATPHLRMGGEALERGKKPQRWGSQDNDGSGYSEGGRRQPPPRDQLAVHSKG